MPRAGPAQTAAPNERRAIQAPAHGLHIVVVTPGDLAADRRGRLVRDNDLAVLRVLLSEEQTEVRTLISEDSKVAGVYHADHLMRNLVR